MKILLVAINAKYIHSNLAVYSLYAYAKEYQENIEIAEYTINQHKDYILEDIYKRKPDVVCFSCYIWNIDYVEAVARHLHKICPHIPIWCGGPEVSYEVENFLTSHGYVTGVMIGEGEETFCQLCGYYAKEGVCDASEDDFTQHPSNKAFDNALQQIDGIAYRNVVQNSHMVESCFSRANWEDAINSDGGADTPVEEIRITHSRSVMDMNCIPFCYEHMDNFSNRIVYYESSRGCPFSCSYCLSSVDKALRFRDIGVVEREIQFFLDEKVPQVKFVDRTFNCNHAHAMAIWQYIAQHDNGVTNFHFEISADLLNEEELELISHMRKGLIQLEIGVQSTNELTIREIRRTMKLERLKEVVLRIQKNHNIHEHLDLIAGLPYEDYESFRCSFDEIYTLKPNQLQLGFLKVLKGSYMYEHAKEYGILYHEEAPYEVLQTKWLSYEDVIRIKQVEETLEVYYNSGQFEITMKLMGVLFDSAFDFYQRLGAFYETHGYFAMSHSRIRRCEILLEFLQEELQFPVSEIKDGTDIMDMVKEALVFDLYYRENCKSRPSWAANPAFWREMTRQYCKKGQLSHMELFHYTFPVKTTRTIQTLPMREESPVYVLFDYENRDPLDHQAFVSYISMGQVKEK